VKLIAEDICGVDGWHYAGMQNSYTGLAFPVNCPVCLVKPKANVFSGWVGFSPGPKSMHQLAFCRATYMVCLL